MEQTVCESAAQWTRQAMELREAGQLEEALTASRQATTLDPSSFKAWWQMTLLVWAKEGPDAALRHLEKTVELAPKFSYAWFQLGRIHKMAGRLEQAIACWERAVQVDPQRIDALNALVQAYNEQEGA